MLSADNDAGRHLLRCSPSPRVTLTGHPLRVLALTEHFSPRVGGTVRYVEETCLALATLGVQLRLLVPGPRPEGFTSDAYPYEIVWLEAGYPEEGEPSRATRYRFCRIANRVTLDTAKRREIDAVHVLFGLFLMEELETEILSALGVRSFATVHNVPPLECRRAHEGSPLAVRLKDALRLRLVTAVNMRRLRRHDYAAYITPSAQVKTLLAKVRPYTPIHIIGHGPTSLLLHGKSPPASVSLPAGGPVRLLTVGGWVPHKRQHLIPSVASRLRAAGLNFSWTVAGPAGRVDGYKACVDAELADLQLTRHVVTHDSLPQAALAAAYGEAHVYVQPSTEEGFCITALDAAAAGLPVIASPAGALEDIAKASGGAVAPSEPDAIAKAILQLVRSGYPAMTEMRALEVRRRFSWNISAHLLIGLYGQFAASGTYAVMAPSDAVAPPAL